MRKQVKGFCRFCGMRLKKKESISIGLCVTCRKAILQTVFPHAISVKGKIVGVQVMTEEMLKQAKELEKQGLGCRQIAEVLTKDGHPVSHATVGRWLKESKKLRYKIIPLKRIKANA